jgi:hypothetical protein
MTYYIINPIIKKISAQVLMAIAFVMAFNACVDQDFDLPEPLDIPVGQLHTIAQIKQMYYDNNQKAVRFSDDISFTGIVTMDGSSGNIYKSVFIEDATAGINVRLMSPGGLYQGDSVRVNLKKSNLNMFMNMLQIDSIHVGNNVTKLKSGVAKNPIETDIITLLSDPAFQGRLVKLTGVEFHPTDLGKTWADADKQLSQNRVISDCNGSQIIVRTSGYASFAAQSVPDGNGTLVAVLAQYNNDRQLYIRNVDEINMKDERCSQKPNENRITLSEVRQLFKDNVKNIPAGKVIIGVVTSDRSTLNITGRNAYLQDETGAVALRFMANHSFNQGDRITITAGSLELSEYEGLLQVNNIPTGNATVNEVNIAVEPVVTTIDNLLKNISQYESKLVKITGVSIPAGGTYSGDKTMTDGTASISLFTRTDATFAGAAVPQGTFTLTGIVSIFKTPNIIIRNLNDIQQ